MDLPESKSSPHVVIHKRKLSISFGSIVTFFSIVFLLVGVIYLYSELAGIKSELKSNQYQDTEPELLVTDRYRSPESGFVSEEELALLEDRLLEKIKEIESSDIALATAPPQEVLTSPVVTSPQVTYIPVTGGFSTNSLTWVDVPGTEVYIDKYSDYGEDATVTWEATIYTMHGNGETHVRLYDATNNIGVDRSELLSSSSEPRLVLSQTLPLWKGNNLYRVQIKSQSGFSSHFDSGRIKISR